MNEKEYSHNRRLKASQQKQGNKAASDGLRVIKKIVNFVKLFEFKNVQYEVLSHIENGLFVNISVNTDNRAMLRRRRRNFKIF